MPAIADFLRRNESRTLEFKQDLSSPDRVLRAIVAFANTTGGTLVVGISDDRQPLGLVDAAMEEERLANLIANGIEPAISPDFQVVPEAGQNFLVVRVPRFPGVFYVKREGATEGVYVRHGSTNRRASPDQLTELHRQAQVGTFDSQICAGASLADFDQSSARQLFAAAGLALTPAKMETLGLLTRSDDTWLPTNGAIILFGTPAARARCFPDSRVQAARFAGPTKAEFLDQLEPDNQGVSILAALEEVPRFVRRNTRTASRITGATLRRQDVPEYSAVALREVLVNALAHADYSRHGMTIKVAIFSNRIEVENPGGWPLGLSEEDFRNGVSRARNPVIAGVLHKLTIMENWGSGFERIETDAQKLGYLLPTWEDKGSVLRAKLMPHPDPQIPTGDEFTLTSDVIVNVRVNERQQWFMDRLADGYLAKAEDIAHKFDVTDRTARRDISQLQEMDLIGFMGSFKTGRYVLLKKGFS
ncbi:RNA-binding domain-containing protein [Hymenobacter baengnokdamensis]|uniref:RNA-binding domain-containing protein n=1 Tax=Hymenobacter baengnokdamensis TaxID=2615203 RepID=UPI00124487DA|nr:RNA-binding domain-containing protein [Hymenobacter baengnokdamensis]